MKGILRFFVLFSLLVPVLMPDAGVSQSRAAVSTPIPAKEQKETIHGTVDYMEHLGGYFIRGENPGGEYFIVNQNPKTLKALKDSGKTVTIIGFTTNQGAEYFFIEKIDGKKYKGAAPVK
jgi:hypothetical protein